MSGRRLSLLAVATSAATLAVTSSALASSPLEPLGVHVSECARVALGQRVDPPAVTCAHDGHMHSFSMFGELVAHLQEQGG